MVTFSEPSEKPWVFVHVPEEESASPRYFVLTAAELHQVLSKRHHDYLVRYRNKHGKEFSGAGVIKLLMSEAAPFEGKWLKLIRQVHGTQLGAHATRPRSARPSA